MKITEDLLMDVRLVSRNVRSGAVSQADYDTHLAKLPDVADRSEVVEIEMADVGVKHAEAKDTGDHD